MQSQNQDGVASLVSLVFGILTAVIAAAVRFPYIAASIAASALICYLAHIPDTPVQLAVYLPIIAYGIFMTRHMKNRGQMQIQQAQIPQAQIPQVQQTQNISKPRPRPIQEIWSEIDSLTGLAEVKQALREIAAVVQADRERQRQGLPAMKQSLHMVFLGPPGTGKTTVARLVGELFAAMGVLPSGHMIETDRSGLVAGYIGQTALKTQDKIRQAMGGVLFIDEAYSLARGGEQDFGKEALDTIIKAMEDFRDRICIIFAGYSKEMQELFKSNSGLESRLAFTITFPDYKPEELLEIASLYAKRRGWRLGPGVEEALLERFRAVPDIGKAGNGRFARNLIEQMERKAAVRISRKQGPLDTLTLDDLA